MPMSSEETLDPLTDCIKSLNEENVAANETAFDSPTEMEETADVEMSEEIPVSNGVDHHDEEIAAIVASINTEMDEGDTDEEPEEVHLSAENDLVVTEITEPQNGVEVSLSQTEPIDAAGSEAEKVQNDVEEAVDKPATNLAQNYRNILGRKSAKLKLKKLNIPSRAMLGSTRVCLKSLKAARPSLFRFEKVSSKIRRPSSNDKPEQRSRKVSTTNFDSDASTSSKHRARKNSTESRKRKTSTSSRTEKPKKSIVTISSGSDSDSDADLKELRKKILKSSQVKDPLDSKVISAKLEPIPEEPSSKKSQHHKSSSSHKHSSDKKSSSSSSSHHRSSSSGDKSHDKKHRHPSGEKVDSSATNRKSSEDKKEAEKPEVKSSAVESSGSKIPNRLILKPFSIRLERLSAKKIEEYEDGLIKFPTPPPSPKPTAPATATTSTTRKSRSRSTSSRSSSRSSSPPVKRRQISSSSSRSRSRSRSSSPRRVDDSKKRKTAVLSDSDDDDGPKSRPSKSETASSSHPPEQPKEKKLVANPLFALLAMRKAASATAASTEDDESKKSKASEVTTAGDAPTDSSKEETKAKEVSVKRLSEEPKEYFERGLLECNYSLRQFCDAVKIEIGAGTLDFTAAFSYGGGHYGVGRSAKIDIGKFEDMVMQAVRNIDRNGNGLSGPVHSRPLLSKIPPVPEKFRSKIGSKVCRVKLKDVSQSSRYRKTFQRARDGWTEIRKLRLSRRKDRLISGLRLLKQKARDAKFSKKSYGSDDDDDNSKRKKNDDAFGSFKIPKKGEKPEKTKEPVKTDAYNHSYNKKPLTNKRSFEEELAGGKSSFNVFDVMSGMKKTLKDDQKNEIMDIRARERLKQQQNLGKTGKETKLDEDKANQDEELDRILSYRVRDNKRGHVLNAITMWKENNESQFKCWICNVQVEGRPNLMTHLGGYRHLGNKRLFPPANQSSNQQQRRPNQQNESNEWPPPKSRHSRPDGPQEFPQPHRRIRPQEQADDPWKFSPSEVEAERLEPPRAPGSPSYDDYGGADDFGGGDDYRDEDSPPPTTTLPTTTALPRLTLPFSLPKPVPIALPKPVPSTARTDSSSINESESSRPRARYAPSPDRSSPPLYSSRSQSPKPGPRVTFDPNLPLEPVPAPSTKQKLSVSELKRLPRPMSMRDRVERYRKGPETPPSPGNDSDIAEDDNIADDDQTPVGSPTQEEKSIIWPSSKTTLEEGAFTIDTTKSFLDKPTAEIGSPRKSTAKPASRKAADEAKAAAGGGLKIKSMANLMGPSKPKPASPPPPEPAGLSSFLDKVISALKKTSQPAATEPLSGGVSPPLSSTVMPTTDMMLMPPTMMDGSVGGIETPQLLDESEVMQIMSEVDPDLSEEDRFNVVKDKMAAAIMQKMAERDLLEQQRRNVSDYEISDFMSKYCNEATDFSAAEATSQMAPVQDEPTYSSALDKLRAKRAAKAATGVAFPMLPGVDPGFSMPLLPPPAVSQPPQQPPLLLALEKLKQIGGPSASGSSSMPFGISLAPVPPPSMPAYPHPESLKRPHSSIDDPAKRLRGPDGLAWPADLPTEFGGPMAPVPPPRPELPPSDDDGLILESKYSANMTSMWKKMLLSPDWRYRLQEYNKAVGDQSAAGDVDLATKFRNPSLNNRYISPITGQPALIFSAEETNGVVHFKCEPCSVTVTGLKNLDGHIEGKKHIAKMKEFAMADPLPASAASMYLPPEPLIIDVLDKFQEAPLIGLEFIVEIPRLSRDPLYTCLLCHTNTMEATELIADVVSAKHRLTYLKLFFPSAYAKFASITDLKTWDLTAFEILESVIFRIEKAHGRIIPTVVTSLEEYNSKSEDIFQKIEKGQHFRESPSIDFTRIPDPFINIRTSRNRSRPGPFRR